jgi:thiol-disulfide isomerase/thioredoxin
VRTNRIELGLLASGLALLCSCKEQVEAKTEPAKTAPQDAGGWYRAALLRPGVEVPFYLSLPADPTKGAAVVLNGRHWFSAPHRWIGEKVEVDFSMYKTKILLTIGEQNLFGTWESSSRAFGEASIPIRAERVDNPDPELKMRAPDSAPPEVALSGWYKLTFSQGGTGKMLAVKEGTTSVGATFWFGDADTTYVSGNIVGKKVLLSGFDATAPYVITLDGDGDKFKGHLVTSTDLSFKEEFTAVKATSDFEIANPVSVTSADRRIRLPELEHPRYAGQPVILQLVGSWCSHCKNSAPVLAKLYERYQKQDLQILTINYEFTHDKSYNLQRAAHFKNDYGITWQLVTRDGSAEEFWRIAPKGLAGNDIPGFPITVFLKRDGTVHQIHTGFVGAESGEAHDRLVELFETWTKDILR